VRVSDLDPLAMQPVNEVGTILEWRGLDGSCSNQNANSRSVNIPPSGEDGSGVTLVQVPDDLRLNGGTGEDCFEALRFHRRRFTFEAPSGGGV
jgi:hypothetical protein